MRTLVIGGAASGKSEYAEALALRLCTPRLYIATLSPTGEEDLERIRKHRDMRARKSFSTVERYTALETLELPRCGVILLECLGNLVANEMFSESGAGRDCAGAVLRGITHLEACCDDLIVVTNDVFRSCADYSPETLRYIDALGEINRAAAETFERVVETVCGIPIFIKGVGL